MAKKTTSDDLITDAREAYEAAQDYEADNREMAEDDLRFARLAEQWESDVTKKRKGRPCLTINRMPAIIRQVVNDARLNKPAIRVRPVDSGADVDTAYVYNGLIRHIEQASHASVAYDTAIDYSASCGIGYFRIGLEYVDDNSFDVEPRIVPVENVFSIYGDPWSTAPDGSDWNCAFVVDVMPEDQYKQRYPKADMVDWNTGEPYNSDIDDGITIAEYWCREEVPRQILLLSNGIVVDRDVYEHDPSVFADVEVIRERTTRGHKVTQRILNGAEVLEEEEWVGKHIPIIPVFGERVVIDGKIHLRSLIRDAKDPARMFNYWRTSSTEIVALAPKVPFIGPVGAFDTDGDKWSTINSETWSHVEYDGDVPPQRQPFAGVPAGMIQEALNSSDDIKAVTGIYDASLGARSNETSGKAIQTRMREGDVSTFHFIDNLARGIEYAGTQLVDIIPKVYTAGRMVRVLGEDSKDVETVKLGAREESTPNMPVFDLSVGRYDLVVDVGPSFTTKREEAATQMMELVRSFPDAAPVIGDLLVKNLDWPGADEIAERLKGLLPQGMNDEGESPEAQQAMARVQELEAENESLKSEKSLDVEELKIKAFEAQTKRLQAEADIEKSRIELSQKEREQTLNMEAQFYGN